MKYTFLLLMCFIILISCNTEKINSDAYGNFESIETTISSEISGKIIYFNIQEGDRIDSGKVVAIIDTTQNYLKLQQLLSQRSAIQSKISTIIAQSNVFKQQKENALKDKSRIDKMFSEKAATQKQLDDINGSIDVINKQIIQIETQNNSVFAEIKSIDAQIEQIKDILKKSIIVCPFTSTVLNKYAEQMEIVSPTKPLFKIANIDNIYLRVYISGDQLPLIKIGQKVKIKTDFGKNNIRTYEGIVSWVSSKSEFTPKIIQTREERVNLVYAVKILVKNDGSIKIGMPGELVLN